MKTTIKALFSHFFVIALFIIAALAYFSPVLQGKKIFQSDIAQYRGMAKEQTDFKKKTGEEPYWTNSAFGGMPTYQLGANYPHNYVKKIDKIIRFLPRPADYLFLYFLGFYILLCCLKVDFKLAAIGALTFGFSTYLIIILGVGHNAKAHALGYLPMLLGGIILVFRKKYIGGFILTAIAMALEIVANHFQMTYYFMLLVLILGVTYLVDAILKKTLKHYFKSVGLLLLAVILGIATNTTSLMATKEYADWSTRGKSQLTIKPDGSPKELTEGLDKEYITGWSYGKLESLNLFIPRLFGGSNKENLGKDSKAYQYLTEQGVSRSQALDFASELPLYWGPQPGTSAPAYVGVVVFFLFFLGLFLVPGKNKWWLLGGSILSLILSWGKNFSLLTDFMIDYFPLYNKFRAVSSIQVILELCVPILAILALIELFKATSSTTKKINALIISASITLGVCILLLLTKGMFYFEGANDATYEKYFGNEVLAMIQLDRESVYTNDIIRSLIYILITAAVIWLFIKEKVSKNLAIIGLGLLMIVDLVGVDLRYVNNDNFVSQRRVNQPFQESAVDKQIRKDKSIFRVYNPAEGLNGASTSYFHQSIGGYHAAKPSGIQDLFDYHIYENNVGVLNMLNVKYVIQQDEDGKPYPATNPNANGNAWFVNNLHQVTSANEEILSLKDLDEKNDAVVNTAMFTNLNKFQYQKDTTATIALTSYEPNHLTYKATNTNDGVAVFSEVYYKNGWNAYIDGKLTDHFKVNYVLRALNVPAGTHKIEFKFEPRVVVKGSEISFAASILLGLIILGGIMTYFRPIKAKETA